MLNKTKKELEKIASSTIKTEDGKLGIRVGKIINKYNVAKFVKAEIKDGKLSWELNNKKIAEEESLDGLYVIFTDVTSEDMNIKEVAIPVKIEKCPNYCLYKRLGYFFAWKIRYYFFNR